MICLPPKSIDKFKQALVKGKINPERLANMTSEARHKLFSEVVGEGEAKAVNSLFESKLLLKNQQQGYLAWAKKVSGVSPEVKRDLISRIQKMDKFLVPEEEKAFLKDLASTRLGVDVTAKEAKQIANMSSKLQTLEAKRKPDGTFPSESDRMAYGYAKVDMGSYVSDLKNAAEKPNLKERALHPIHETSKAAGLVKSLKASLDNSAIFRQGWKTIWTNPVIWQKNARKSFIDIAKQLGNKNVLREVQAEIVSRPNYDKYEKMKLAIGNVEEEFPSTLPEKVPGLGRVYKASESAYTGFLYRQRADIADSLLKIAKDSGVNLNDKRELESIGKMINSLTGRGHLGRFDGEAATTLNNIFFSARFLKSNIDTLTAHQLQKNVTPFVRKRAAVNLVKIISGTAAIMGIANAVKPGSVELDPRSSDFGKIKVGNTRFDVTGGQAGIPVLAAQLIKQSTKSPTTGIVSKLNDGYGSKTGVDLVNNFFENKFSPAASVVKDIIKQQDFNGNKPTVKGEAANLLVPLPITTNISTREDPHGANALLTSIADGLGIASNTYGKTKRSTEKLTKTQQAFKDKVGDTKFEQANKEYGQRYDDWLKENKDQLNGRPQDEQSGDVAAIKTKIQHSIYKKYGFKPPKVKQDSGRKTLLNSVK